MDVEGGVTAETGLELYHFFFVVLANMDVHGFLQGVRELANRDFPIAAGEGLEVQLFYTHQPILNARGELGVVDGFGVALGHRYEGGASPEVGGDLCGGGGLRCVLSEAKQAGARKNDRQAGRAHESSIELPVRTGSISRGALIGTHYSKGLSP